MIHEDALVDPSARIGAGTQIWGMAQVRENASLGAECRVGRGAYIDAGVVIGDRCKLQNFAQIYAPARLGEGVFVGPQAVITNDRHPRAILPEGLPKSREDWSADGVTIEDGASVGANSVLIAGVRVGRWALIAAGAVVARDVPAFALVAGVPARQIGWVGMQGARLSRTAPDRWRCPITGSMYVESATGLMQV